MKLGNFDNNSSAIKIATIPRMIFNFAIFTNNVFNLNSIINLIYFQSNKLLHGY